jgi:hypothetical protein
MRKGVFSFVFGLFLLSAGTAQAQARFAENPSLDRVLPQIRSRHPGTFYDAQGPWRGADGRLVYRLKWMMPGGRIVWFDADARTGRVLGPDMEVRHDFYRGGDRPQTDDDRRWNRGYRYDVPHPHKRR